MRLNLSSNKHVYSGRLFLLFLLIYTIFVFSTVSITKYFYGKETPVRFVYVACYKSSSSEVYTRHNSLPLIIQSRGNPLIFKHI